MGDARYTLVPLASEVFQSIKDDHWVRAARYAERVRTVARAAGLRNWDNFREVVQDGYIERLPENLRLELRGRL